MIKKKLLGKVNSENKEEMEQVLLNFDESSFPFLCFKCHYELVLVGKDGRHKALQVYNIAAMDSLNSNRSFIRSSVIN